MAQNHSLPIARDIMTTRLITVSPELSIFDAIRSLLKNQISGAPVIDDGGALVGMLSELDCLKVLANGEFYDDDHSEEGFVRDYMTMVTQSIDPQTDVYSLAQYFLNHTVRRLPVVVRGSVLLGQISRRDVLRTIEEIGGKRVPRKRYPDYRAPMDRSNRTAHLHHR
jgi:CBS domain-containing protein